MCERERENVSSCLSSFCLSLLPSFHPSFLYFLCSTLTSFLQPFPPSSPSFLPFNPSSLPSPSTLPSFLQPFLPSSPSTLPRFLPSPIVCADAITCREKRPGDPRATSRFARRPEGFSCLLRAPLSLSMVPPAFFAS